MLIYFTYSHQYVKRKNTIKLIMGCWTIARINQKKIISEAYFVYWFLNLLTSHFTFFHYFKAANSSVKSGCQTQLAKCSKCTALNAIFNWSGFNSEKKVPSCDCRVIGLHCSLYYFSTRDEIKVLFYRLFSNTSATPTIQRFWKVFIAIKISFNDWTVSVRRNTK